jgi:hypothetical protein
MEQDILEQCLIEENKDLWATQSPPKELPVSYSGKNRVTMEHGKPINIKMTIKKEFLFLKLPVSKPILDNQNLLQVKGPVIHEVV